MSYKKICVNGVDMVGNDDNTLFMPIKGTRFVFYPKLVDYYKSGECFNRFRDLGFREGDIFKFQRLFFYD